MNKEQILYEDNDILVCYKPAGIATQSAGIGQRDMVSEVTNYIARKSAADRKLSKPAYVGLVHRLDQPVEGILVFAKNQRAASALSKQIPGNQMEKYYYGVVSINKAAENKAIENDAIENKAAEEKDTEIKNTPNDTNEKTLIDYLYKDGRNNISSVVDKEHSGAKRAELRYEVLSRISIEEFVKDYKDRSAYPDDDLLSNLADFKNMDMAMVRIKLITGRHHQIRAQMSHAGMSLMGDYKYADDRTKKLSEIIARKQIALCAYKLEFNHPITGKRMSFQKEPEGQIFQNFSL